MPQRPGGEQPAGDLEVLFRHLQEDQPLDLLGDGRLKSLAYGKTDWSASTRSSNASTLASRRDQRYWPRLEPSRSSMGGPPVIRCRVGAPIGSGIERQELPAPDDSPSSPVERPIRRGGNSFHDPASTARGLVGRETPERVRREVADHFLPGVPVRLAASGPIPDVGPPAGPGTRSARPRSGSRPCGRPDRHPIARGSRRPPIGLSVGSPGSFLGRRPSGAAAGRGGRPPIPDVFESSHRPMAASSPSSTMAR